MGRWRGYRGGKNIAVAQSVGLHAGLCSVPFWSRNFPEVEVWLSPLSQGTWDTFHATAVCQLLAKSLKYSGPG